MVRSSPKSWMQAPTEFQSRVASSGSLPNTSVIYARKCFQPISAAFGKAQASLALRSLA